MYAKEIAFAVFDGVRRTFEDFGGSGNIVRLNNVAENKRATIVIENAIKFANADAGPITEILKIILEEFYQNVSDDVIEKVAKKAGVGVSYMTSRMVTQAALVNLIAKKLAVQITTRVIARRLAKLGVGFVLGALIIQGMIEKASESAQKLKFMHPKIYNKLRAKNIDMAYFLVEDSMTKTMEAIRMKSGNPEKFNKILQEIENEILVD